MNDILDFDAKIAPDSFDLPMEVTTDESVLPMSLDQNIEVTDYDDTELRERVGTLEKTAELIVEYATPVIEDAVRPEYFGAKGDGNTDDTAAIQAAIDSGKCVRFSSKSYKITAPIRLRSGLSLIGSNHNQSIYGDTVIRCAGTDAFDYTFNAGTNDISNVVISGISFVGDSDLSHNVFRPGVSNAGAFTLSHCGFQRFNTIFPYDTSGGQFGMTYWYAHDIAAIKINSIGRISGSDHTFERWNCGDYAVVDEPYLIVVRCALSHFKDMFFTAKLNATHGADSIMEISGDWVFGNVFDGCWFDYCDGDGVVIAKGARDNLITGCTFRGLGRASTTSSRKRDVNIGANCTRNTITNCSFLHIHAGPEVPDSAQRWSISSVAKGNIISNNMYQDGLLNHYIVGDAGENNTVEEPTEHAYFGGALRWKTSSYYGINFASYPKTILAHGEKDISVTAVNFYSALIVPFIRGDFSLPTGITLARAYVDSGNLHIVFANTTESDVTINDETKYFGVNYVNLSIG